MLAVWLLFHVAEGVHGLGDVRGHEVEQPRSSLLCHFCLTSACTTSTRASGQDCLSTNSNVQLQALGMVINSSKQVPSSFAILGLPPFTQLQQGLLGWGLVSAPRAMISCRPLEWWWAVAYISDTNRNFIKKWSAIPFSHSTGYLFTLASFAVQFSRQM